MDRDRRVGYRGSPARDRTRRQQLVGTEEVDPSEVDLTCGGVPDDIVEGETFQVEATVQNNDPTNSAEVEVVWKADGVDIATDTVEVPRRGSATAGPETVLYSDVVDAAGSGEVDIEVFVRNVDSQPAIGI